MSKFYSNSTSYSIEAHRLNILDKIKAVSVQNVGNARMIDKENFPVLEGVTCYSVEIWEACMRLPHWHPNAAELGYVVSGKIQIIIWRSPGESAVFTLGPGMCWFIPQASLHSLNNIGNEKAILLVGFSSDLPQDIDLPVAYNGIPVPVRNAYTSPHSELREWQGVVENPLVGRFQFPEAVNEVLATSPYGFDLAKVTPLFSDPAMGSVIWGIKDNWPILENISVLRAHLKANTARDAIWYPDVGTLYVVSEGQGEFHIIMADHNPKPLKVGHLDYIFVPTGVLHTFLNPNKEDFEVVAFFSKANPQPEVSLAVSTAFFPDMVRKAALTEYGAEHKTGDPLKEMPLNKTSPYLLKI